jgi:transposase InsO family protein
MVDLCEYYGISRKTGYKWIERFHEYGDEGLKDLSRAPNKLPCHYTSEQIERAIDLKYKRRNWGPKKIVARLKEDYPNENWPSPSRLYQIFKDQHLVTKTKYRSRVPATSPLGDLTKCNDTWCIDFKGWFLTANGEKCEPFTITDGVSRFAIRCIHLPNHSVEYVWAVIEEAFREYGRPLRIRSDNGPPFGSTGAGRLTSLSVKLIKAEVIPEWIRPGHPEENGRHERFHATLKKETASPPEATLALQIDSMNRFLEVYNFERPHESLGMKTPGSCYNASPRRWRGILKSPEYDGAAMDVRKVCPSGCIWLQQNEYYIGQTLTGEHVGLKEVAEGKLEVYFGPVYLGILDRKTGLQKPKLKTRRQR